MDPKRKKIGEILLEKGMVTLEQLNIALAEQQRKPDQFLGDILIKKRFIRDNQLAEVLSLQFTIPLIELKYKYLDWDFLAGFSSSLILTYRAIPVEEKSSRLTIAISNPLDMNILKKAEEEARAKGLMLSLAIASASDIEFVVKRYKEHFGKR